MTQVMSIVGTGSACHRHFRAAITCNTRKAALALLTSGSWPAPAVKDKWNAKDIAAMEEARAGSASPRVRVRSPRRERPGERKREAEAYMKPLAITEARLAMTGRERDPRGILSTALFSEIKDSTAQVLASEADVRCARGKGEEKNGEAVPLRGISPSTIAVSGRRCPHSTFRRSSVLVSGAELRRPG